MVSIITVVNNKKIFEGWLKSSLEMQVDFDYELIIVDNTDNKFLTLEQAYSDGLKRANGEWLMFVHPDVRFLHNKTLKKFYKDIKNGEKDNKNIALWGVAGVEPGRYRFRKSSVSSIVHGINPRRVVRNHFYGRKYVVVQTVDACCFTIRKAIFDKFGFSNQLLGFHMLVEELCIRLKENGLESSVLPIALWHRSKGDSMDYTYFLAVMKVLKMHPDLKYLNTTSVHLKVDVFHKIKLVYQELKLLLKYILN